MSYPTQISYLAHEVTDDALCAQAQRVIKLLVTHHMTITTAESCTGGMVASYLTAVPGSSEVFEGGFVTYSNRVKHEVIGVSSSVLESFGAVSEQTVIQMASGAAQALGGSNIAISVSGIAGPDGGSPEKPVGTVWFGCSLKDKTEHEQITTFHCLFEGDRNHIRRSSTLFILTKVEETLRALP